MIEGEHRVRLFVGTKAALRVIVGLVPVAQAFALTPGASVFALPLTDEVHDGLHRVNGTGEWIEFGEGAELAPLLTTTDMACAARASLGSALAWIETGHAGGAVEQVAAVWIDGALAMKPNVLQAGENRQRSLRPVNMALRLLGVHAGAVGDEFAAFGFARYETTEVIVARAVRVGV
ncbi:MAG: hypothetical protein ABL901_08760 [Hyphomicrobiaceae bacterium]